MDKDTIKRILNDLIDAADEVQSLSILNDVEEIDRSTLDEERVERYPTGLTNIHITLFKE